MRGGENYGDFALAHGVHSLAVVHFGGRGGVKFVLWDKTKNDLVAVGLQRSLAISTTSGARLI